jgi:hypothetical protein
MVLPIQRFFLIVLVMCVVLLRAEETRNIVPGAYIVEFSPSFTRLRTNNHVCLFTREHFQLPERFRVGT